MNPLYERKSDSYFIWDRLEMLPFIPQSAKRVLDVGCGAGVFGEHVKAARGATVWGVEPDIRAADAARSRLDHVIAQKFTPDLDLLHMRFDCILFNDVLEHMYDPWTALQVAKKHLTGTGVVVASLPNLAYFNILWDLVVRAEWRYEEAGILDVTHIRFFTRKGMIRLFTEAGYVVERIEGINPQAQGRKYKLINALCLNRLADMKCLQFAVVAAPGVESRNDDESGHHLS